MSVVSPSDLAKRGRGEKHESGLSAALRVKELKEEAGETRCRFPPAVIASAEHLVSIVEVLSQGSLCAAARAGLGEDAHAQNQ